MSWISFKMNNIDEKLFLKYSLELFMNSREYSKKNMVDLSILLRTFITMNFLNRVKFD